MPGLTRGQPDSGHRRAAPRPTRNTPVAQSGRGGDSPPAAQPTGRAAASCQRSTRQQTQVGRACPGATATRNPPVAQPVQRVSRVRQPGLNHQTISAIGSTAGPGPDEPARDPAARRLGNSTAILRSLSVTRLHGQPSDRRYPPTAHKMPARVRSSAYLWPPRLLVRRPRIVRPEDHHRPRGCHRARLVPSFCLSAVPFLQFYSSFFLV
jgi:hypothetical protein